MVPRHGSPPAALLAVHLLCTALHFAHTRKCCKARCLAQLSMFLCCRGIVAAEGQVLELGWKQGGSRITAHKLSLEQIQKARSAGFGSGTGYWPPKL